MHPIIHFYILDFKEVIHIKKIANKIIIIGFIIIIFGINNINLLTPDRTFSESENRVLSQIPKLSISNIISGRFSKKFEKYVKDQFVFKDFWVGLKSDFERLTFKKENNGIFFGKDGYLIEKFNKPNGTLKENIDSVNYFKRKLPNVSIYLLLIPNSVKIYEEKLPLFAYSYDQLKVIEEAKESLNRKIDFIDVYSILERKKDEYIYFRTDHHWTMRGAYYAYVSLCKEIGLKPYSSEYYTIKKVSDNFYGTFYSRANNRHIPDDFIEVFKPKFDMEYKVHYLDTDIYTNTMYELRHLNKKDKYSMFLDGNHSLVTIKTNVENNKKLLIIKDSYAHNFIPFLANHYEEIHVIDLRYYKLDVYDYIKENRIFEVLFLYNISTFSSDKNISLIKRYDK